MKPRVDPGARRLPDAQRARLKTLLAAVPADPDANDPVVRRLLSFGLSLRTPWWGPTNNALNYMVRLAPLDVALDALRLLAECDDWGEPPRGAEAAATETT